MRRRRGFTLVELLLALAIFGVLALFVFGVVRAVLGLWETGERRGRGDLEFAAALNRLRSDLQALHAGPSGWLVLDDYEAAPASSSEPAWRLPRLRFLARGEALPGDDPDGHAGVEVAWLLVPESPADSRLTRLLRLSLLQNPDRSLAEDRVLATLVREGAGLTVLDGVAWLRWEVVDEAGARQPAARIEARQPFGFPAAVELSLERVSAGARATPLRLDEDLGEAPGRVLLRGAAPLVVAETALIEREWVAVSGRFPQLTAVERGLRGSAAAAHPRGATVWLAERFSGRCALSAAGRRLP